MQALHGKLLFAVEITRFVDRVHHEKAFPRACIVVNGWHESFHLFFDCRLNLETLFGGLVSIVRTKNLFKRCLMVENRVLFEVIPCGLRSDEFIIE